MSDHDREHDRDEVDGTETGPPLDPQTIARRRAAMAQIVQWGDPVLKSRARPVETFDAALRDEVARMAQLMEDALGAGLAATQLGVLRRVLVYRVGDEPTRALVNPEIVWSSEEREVFGEGCLSLPGVRAEIERPSVVRVAAQDERGTPVELEASGPEASVVQHEIDHLDGVLVLDHMDRPQRRGAMRRLREEMAARG